MPAIRSQQSAPDRSHPPSKYPSAGELEWMKASFEYDNYVHGAVAPGTNPMSFTAVLKDREKRTGKPYTGAIFKTKGPITIMVSPGGAPKENAAGDPACDTPPRIPRCSTLQSSIQQWEHADPTKNHPHALKDWPDINPEWQKNNSTWRLRALIADGFKRAGRDWDVFHKRFGTSTTVAAAAIRAVREEESEAMVQAMRVKVRQGGFGKGPMELARKSDARLAEALRSSSLAEE